MKWQVERDICIPNHGQYVINYNMFLVVEKNKSNTVIIRSYIFFLINSWYIVTGALMMVVSNKIEKKEKEK